MAAKKGDGGQEKLNKVQMLWVNSDLTDESVQQLAQVLGVALRPVMVAPRSALGSATASALPSGNGSTPAVEDAEVLNDGETESTNGAASEKTARGPKKPRSQTQTVNYLHDLPLESQDTPLKKFAAQYAPKKHSRRYLTIAAWFKDHFGREAITIHDVYTCYKTLNWPTNIEDWDKTFRQMVHQRWMRRVQEGQYAITPVGESKLQGKGSAEDNGSDG
jgi:hypothetical protein